MQLCTPCHEGYFEFISLIYWSELAVLFQQNKEVKVFQMYSLEPCIGFHPWPTHVHVHTHWLYQLTLDWLQQPIVLWLLSLPPSTHTLTNTYQLRTYVAISMISTACVHAHQHALPIYTCIHAAVTVGASPPAMRLMWEQTYKKS